MRWMAVVSCFALSLAAAGSNHGTADDSAAHCRSLVALRSAETDVSSAALAVDRRDVPDYCQLEGRIAGRVGFVMRLPVQRWNGKLAVTGCGGFCGGLRPDKPGHSNGMNEALKLGFAVIQTDSGHQAPSWDADWAVGDATALALYAGAWMPLAVASARQFIRQYYAQAPRRTYFSGCSNGGRLGLFAAQRYPALFDGIAAGGGIFDMTGNAAIHGLWLLQSTRDGDGRAVIDRAKIPLLQSHVLERCDAIDGVVDGVVSRPANCRPQVSDLQCDQADGPDCLTQWEVAAIERLYRGATVNGVQLYPGIPPGSEALWPLWITGTDAEPAWGERAAQATLRLTYGVRAQQPFNAHDYVLADELQQLRRLAPIVNATDPDLSAFAAGGGKLLYYHGLADPLILPQRAQQYYREVAALHGEEPLAAFGRFVMVPGFGHCWEKPGAVADEFNPLAIIDRWVESGTAPADILALQLDAAGEPLRSRKLCPLPRQARFDGGDPNLAKNYSCVTLSAKP